MQECFDKKGIEMLVLECSLLEGYGQRLSSKDMPPNFKGKHQNRVNPFAELASQDPIPKFHSDNGLSEIG